MFSRFFYLGWFGSGGSEWERSARARLQNFEERDFWPFYDVSFLSWKFVLLATLWSSFARPSRLCRLSSPSQSSRTSPPHPTPDIVKTLSKCPKGEWPPFTAQKFAKQHPDYGIFSLPGTEACWRRPPDPSRWWSSASCRFLSCNKEEIIPKVRLCLDLVWNQWYSDSPHCSDNILYCCISLRRPLPYHSYSIAFSQLVQIELTILSPEISGS